MEFINKLVKLIDVWGPVPKLYGWYHILCLALTVALTAFLILKFKNADDKTFRKIILITWITIVVFEVYKQVVTSFNSDNDTWKYLWYYFPFQFCSSPLYVLPFVALLKEGKVRDAFIAFTMSFAFFGGLVVMLYPGDVFQGCIGINLQTMVHHASQVIIGIFVAVHQRRKFSKGFFLSAAAVFAAIVVIAIGFNVVGHMLIPEQGLNMFFVGPYVPSALPVFSIIYPLVPWPVFLAIYILGFSLVAMLICFVANLIYTKGKKDENKAA